MAADGPKPEGDLRLQAESQLIKVRHRLPTEFGLWFDQQQDVGLRASKQFSGHVDFPQGSRQHDNSARRERAIIDHEQDNACSDRG